MTDTQIIRKLRKYNSKIADRFEEIKRELVTYKVAYKSAVTKAQKYKEILDS